MAGMSVLANGNKKPRTLSKRSGFWGVKHGGHRRRVAGRVLVADFDLFAFGLANVG